MFKVVCYRIVVWGKGLKHCRKRDKFWLCHSVFNSIQSTFLHLLYSFHVFFAIMFLALSHIHQICSRQLWTYLEKDTEKLYKCRYNYWKIVENIVEKGEIARYEQFLLSSLCFQKPSAAEASESVHMWGRIKVSAHVLHVGKG